MPSNLMDESALFKQKDKLSDGSYCTLSHQWGNQGDKMLKLITKSLSHFENGFSRPGFPLMFYEAAAAAHSLQLPYLSIDSLCILQDNLKVFEVEAASMCEVYGNSALNLSATANTSNERSWFYSRKPRSIYPCVVRI